LRIVRIIEKNKVMKANEVSAKDLMVGDWVYGIFSGCPQERIIMKYSICSNGYEWKYMPIPLTPEILKKNGFEYFHKNYSSLSYDHPFKLKMTNWPDENGLGGLWTICDIVEIRFVHQLQHALRLCEIEKEIVL
jgi:hypothetical protein